MDASTLSWIVMAILLLFIVQAISHYSTVRLLTSGRGLFDRKPDLSRIHTAPFDR